MVLILTCYCRYWLNPISRVNMSIFHTNECHKISLRTRMSQYESQSGHEILNQKYDLKNGDATAPAQKWNFKLRRYLLLNTVVHLLCMYLSLKYDILNFGLITWDSWALLKVICKNIDRPKINEGAHFCYRFVAIRWFIFNKFIAQSTSRGAPALAFRGRWLDFFIITSFDTYALSFVLRAARAWDRGSTV